MKIVGHRGFAARYLENSLEGIAAALRAGADGVEVDLRLTRDGEGVLMHDASTARTCEQAHLVEETPWSILQTVRLKNGEAVPRLADLFAAVPASRTLLLEVKPQAAAPLCSLLDRFREELVSRADAGELVLMSFSTELVGALAHHLPEVPIWVLSSDTEAVRGWLNDGALPRGAQRVSPNEGLALTEAEWRQLQDRGWAGAVWTVNPPASGEPWRWRGLRCLISDDAAAYLH